MKRRILVLCTLLLPAAIFAQSLSALDVLGKSIAYHDPSTNWGTFSDRFYVTMETPNNPDRVSEIILNLPADYFYLKAEREGISVQYTMEGDSCKLSLNDKAEFTEAEAEKYNVNCERGELFKDYYTYLYGLPMKLLDPGTNIDPTVEKVTFKGKEYLRIKVTYDPEVGTDVWFFYFDPYTFAMEVYQFYKGDPEGEGKDTGEYILLSEQELVYGIKMPKTRAWYYNKDDKYLGTDILSRTKE